MRCGKVKKLSFKFYEESLSKEQMDEIKEHLKECPWCASEYKKVKKMMNAIENDSPKLVPDELHKNIMVEVNGMKSFNETEKRENKIAVVTALRRASVALAAVFIVAFGLSFIDFKNIDIKNMNVLKLNEKVNEAIEKEKAENTKSKSLTADDLLFSSKKSDTKAAAEEASEEESNDGIKVVSDNLDFGVTTNDDAYLDKTLEEDASEKEESTYAGSISNTTNDIISQKGFSNVDEYALVLETDDEVTKKGLMNLYTSNFDKSLDELKKSCDKYNAKIYYENIYLNNPNNVLTQDDDRICTVALRVLGENYNNLKNEIEKLGKYDINVTQDEIDIETKEDVEVMLSNVREQLLTHKNERDSLDKDSDNYDTEEAALSENIKSEEEAIKNLEAKLEAKSKEIEIVKLEVTFKEISEEDLEGILSGKTFANGIKKGFINGWNNFVRMLQDVFLWITENILFIIFFLILFAFVFFGLKTFLLKDRD